MVPCKAVRARLIGLLIVLSAPIASGATAQLLLPSTPQPELVERIHGARIDWGRGCYYATGEGVVPSPNEEPNRAKAYLKAKGYGKMKAIANLLMAVEGTTISYKAIGKDYIGKDVTLRQTIEGYASKVQVVEEKQQVSGEESLVVVTVRSPMYGENGPGTAILMSKFRNEKPGTELP